MSCRGQKTETVPQLWEAGWLHQGGLLPVFSWYRHGGAPEYFDPRENLYPRAPRAETPIGAPARKEAQAAKEAG
jgi:hypothetical protein